jgi:hypothetical protein
MGVAANEGACVARPEISPGQLAGQVNAEMLFEQGFVVKEFVMCSHVENIRNFVSSTCAARWSMHAASLAQIPRTTEH